MQRPSRRGVLAGLGAAALGPADRAGAQGASEVLRVIARARAATGGRAWNGVRGFHEVGHDAGLRFERWIDVLRYGLRVETATPAGKAVSGYNGYGAWWLAPSGQASGPADPDAQAQVRSDAYFAAFGYYFPSRFDLSADHVGMRQAQGASFEVVRVRPAGGKSRTLWFDRRTGLLGRLVDETAAQPVTVELSDYRPVGALLLPFRRTTFGGDLPRPREQRIESIDVRPVERELFSLPRRPDQVDVPFTPPPTRPPRARRTRRP